jgi:hypothetical protein
MCACDPPCVPLEGTWPTEACPNPDCTDTAKIRPVGAHRTGPGSVGLTFHCRSCPARWFSPCTVTGQVPAGHE